MTARHGLFLFGVNRSHEWQVRELVHRGLSVYGWHLRGGGYLPLGTKEIELSKPNQSGQGADVYYLNEAHFSSAKSYADAIGANFRGWSGKYNDKYLQRQALQATLPSSFRFGREELLVNWAKSEKLVVKPGIRTGASLGVRIFSRDTQPEAIQHYEKLRLSGFQPLVETEILGDEYCVDGFVRDGNVEWIAVGKYYFNSGQDLIHGILFGVTPNSMVRDFWSRSATILASLGYSEGPFHIEFRATPEEIVPIEAHGRFGGSIVTEATHRFTGESPFLGLSETRLDALPSRLVLSEFFYSGDLSFAEARNFVFESTSNGSFTGYPNEAEQGSDARRIGYLTVEGKNFDELRGNREELLVKAKVSLGASFAPNNILEVM